MWGVSTTHGAVPHFLACQQELFNLNFRKQKQRGPSASSSVGEPDAYAKHFGTAIPKNIPERLCFSVRVFTLHDTTSVSTTLFGPFVTTPHMLP